MDERQIIRELSRTHKKLRAIAGGVLAPYGVRLGQNLVLEELWKARLEVDVPGLASGVRARLESALPLTAVPVDAELLTPEGPLGWGSVRRSVAAFRPCESRRCLIPPRRIASWSRSIADRSRSGARSRTASRWNRVDPPEVGG